MARYIQSEVYFINPLDFFNIYFAYSLIIFGCSGVLVAAYGIQFPDGDLTPAPCIVSAESQLLGHQEVLHLNLPRAFLRQEILKDSDCEGPWILE